MIEDLRSAQASYSSPWLHSPCRSVLVSSLGYDWIGQWRREPATSVTYSPKSKTKAAGRTTAVSDEPGVEPAVDISALTFDEALLQLQRAVAELEQGGLPLERSIALYERGVVLHERCAALLADAELRVQKLLERSSGALEAVEIRSGDAADQE